MCHVVGQDSYMINITKVSNVLCALLVLHDGCLCFWGGGGGHCHVQQRTRSRMARSISLNPHPTIVSP